jgi:signal transduction histidine kinase
VEPDKLIQGMEELVRHTVGPGIAVDIHLCDGVWRVLCDANQLESALLNLTINARDAMPDGGTLKIATADRSLSHADVSDHDEDTPGDYVEITVTDTGMGMPPDVLARAFEPFFTTKPTGYGTGLGLSQVFGFVRQSGGFMRLESRLGLGTTVRVYLPRHEFTGAETDRGQQASPSPQSTDLTAAEAYSKTGLVVEDEADVRSMIADVLRDWGVA